MLCPSKMLFHDIYSAYRVDFSHTIFFLAMCMLSFICIGFMGLGTYRIFFMLDNLRKLKELYGMIQFIDHELNLHGEPSFQLQANDLSVI